MQQVEIDSRGKLALLRLANGATNAIGPMLLSDLATALEEIKANYRGVLLAGNPKFFSMGFDLPQLLAFDRVAMGKFFSRFNNLCLELYTLPMPTACIMAGHAVAGGAILALTGDFRYAAADKKKVGLNEIKLGLPVPYLADLLLRQLVGDRVATSLLYGGDFVTMARAEEIGLVDAVWPAEELEAKALTAVETLAAYQRDAFGALKASRVETTAAQYRAGGEAKLKTFLDCWFRPEVQSLLTAAAEKF